MLEARKVVCLGIADCGIETAFPFAGRQHVPQADTMRQQALQPLRIGEGDEFFAEYGRQQTPKLVTRMRVVLLRGERSFAGEAAQNEDTGIAVEDRRQAGQW